MLLKGLPGASIPIFPNINHCYSVWVIYYQFGVLLTQTTYFEARLCRLYPGYQRFAYLARMIVQGFHIGSEVLPHLFIIVGLGFLQLSWSPNTCIRETYKDQRMLETCLKRERGFVAGLILFIKRLQTQRSVRVVRQKQRGLVIKQCYARPFRAIASQNNKANIW